MVELPIPQQRHAPDVAPGLPRIGPAQRLSATMMLSLVLFGVLVLGVGFSQDDAAPVVPTLDVILTQTSTPQPPKQADFLAQANNQGGGNQAKAERPHEAQFSQVPKPDPGVAAQTLTAQAPPPEDQAQQRLLTTVGASDRSVAAPQDRPNSETRPLPTGSELMQDAQMARMAAEIAVETALYAKRPKVKKITASTRQFEYASYMRAWVAKVERVGNLNYPTEAERLGMSGQLIMTVSIGRNGEVKSVLINRSSGKKLLDSAAVKAVNLSSPFAPLPSTQEDIDILDITRTWHYSNGSVGSQ